MGIYWNGELLKSAEYTGSSFRKGRTVMEIAKARSGEHRRAAKGGKHNPKVNALVRTLPVPPRVGRAPLRI
jgi:hypothetical protein